MFYHTHTIASIFEQLDTSETGLSPENAEDRFDRYGPNTLSESERRSLLTIIIDQFKSPYYLCITDCGSCLFCYQRIQ